MPCCNGAAAVADADMLLFMPCHAAGATASADRRRTITTDAAAICDLPDSCTEHSQFGRHRAIVVGEIRRCACHLLP